MYQSYRKKWHIKNRTKVLQIGNFSYHLARKLHLFVHTFIKNLIKVMNNNNNNNNRIPFTMINKDNMLKFHQNEHPNYIKVTLINQLKHQIITNHF